MGSITGTNSRGVLVFGKDLRITFSPLLEKFGKRGPDLARLPQAMACYGAVEGSAAFQLHILW